VKTYKEMWGESQKGAWAVAGACPKCKGRAYVGGYCMDCGAYWPPGKKQMDARCGVIERLFDAAKGGEL
jgi:hypothetical protein